MPFYVLKVGGSLIHKAKALMVQVRCLEEKGFDFLIVPGGGPMADLIRDISSDQRLSEEASHWMAILAMEQYGYLLADGCEAELTREISRIEGVKVLLPYQALLKDDSGLEHSWDFTSDSVAALAAQRLGADMIKATDVEGIKLNGNVVKKIRARDLRGIRTCLDQGSLKLLQGRRCWILNGTNPERFAYMILSGEGGTVITG
jgi:5-(aminomethyl)-3-furanmethanol phosphate kinase